MLGIKAHQITQNEYFDRFARNCITSTLEHFTENTIWLNYENLSTIPCPRSCLGYRRTFSSCKSKGNRKLNVYIFVMHSKLNKKFSKKFAIRKRKLVYCLIHWFSAISVWWRHHHLQVKNICCSTILPSLVVNDLKMQITP